MNNGKMTAMDRLKDACRERGTAIVDSDIMPDDDIKFVSRWNAVFVGRNTSPETIKAFVNRFISTDI